MPDFNELFSFKNLYKAYSKCRKGVGWKASVQSYGVNLLTNTWEIYSKLQSETYKSRGFVCFKLSERGKTRDIKSVHISERCVQQCLCDNYLVPALSHNLIYDNGACLKDKGTDFSINRFKTTLEQHIQAHGLSGYIVQFDFKDYFASIDHKKLYAITDQLLTDTKIRRQYHYFVDAFGNTGLGLGSPISQISAVVFSNAIDHVFKDRLGVKGYGRHMDDGYISAERLEDAKMYVDALYAECEKLDIKINPNKIKISKIKNGVTFLKKRFKPNKQGKIAVAPIRKTFKRQRDRLRSHKRLVDSGVMPYRDAEQVYKSWRGSFKRYDCKNQIKACDDLYNNLFIYQGGM